MSTPIRRLAPLVFFACIALQALRYDACGAQDEEDILIVASSAGPVQVFNASKNTWEDMRVPYTLSPNDIIKTSAGGSCEVGFGQSRVKITENSEVTTSSVMNQIQLVLAHGSLLVKLKSLSSKSDFVVETPQAIAGARGTKYRLVVMRERPLTRVSVLESSVDLASSAESAKSVVINAYQEREISPWEKAILAAKGTGILSKAILGSDAGKAALPGALREIGETDYGSIFGALAKVTTKRAAVTDAYRKLAEKTYGVVVDSKTTLENFAVTNDTIRTTVRGIVQGAREVKTQYYSDGSVAVAMEIDGVRVKNECTPLAGDIFGVDCIPGPDVVTAADFEDFFR